MDRKRPEPAMVPADLGTTFEIFMRNVATFGASARVMNTTIYKLEPSGDSSRRVSLRDHVGGQSWEHGVACFSTLLETIQRLSAQLKVTLVFRWTIGGHVSAFGGRRSVGQSQYKFARFTSTAELQAWMNNDGRGIVDKRHISWTCFVQP